jgi:hypothetical protein
MYEGENRQTGALVHYYAAPKGKKNPKDSTSITYSDSLTIQVFDSKGLLVRNLKQKVDSVGFGTLKWRLDEKGMRSPGSKKPKSTNAESGGMDVLPGIYKIVVKMDSTSDSTAVTVKSDFRKKHNLADETEKRAVIKRLQKSTEKLVAATDQIEESSVIVENILAQLKGNDNKSLDTLRKASKAMVDSLKAANEIVMGKKFTRQGYGRPYQTTAPAAINEASGYLRSKSKIGRAEMILVETAEAETAKTIARVNEFFSTQWATYRKLVENAKVPMFKDYSKIE